MVFSIPLKSIMKNLKIGSKIDNETSYHEVDVTLLWI
jgi:hypothetical protein